MDKIVLIEDDPGIRTVIRLALKGAGFTSICEAGNGTEGLALVQREKPALVILDIMLPGMDGLSVCSAIRRTSSVSGTPIVILTARPAEEDVVRKLERFRSNFISNVTHEIRTPVTGILGATEMLADDTAQLDSADRAELQNVIKNHSSRLVALVDDILALAGLEKAEAEHDAAFAPCAVADIAQTAVNLARPAAKKAGVALSFVRKMQETDELVRPCDARLVESAIANLIQNALRYSGSTEVEISVEPVFPVRE